MGLLDKVNKLKEKANRLNLEDVVDQRAKDRIDEAKKRIDAGKQTLTAVLESADTVRTKASELSGQGEVVGKITQVVQDVAPVLQEHAPAVKQAIDKLDAAKSELTKYGSNIENASTKVEEAVSTLVDRANLPADVLPKNLVTDLVEDAVLDNIPKATPSEEKGTSDADSTSTTPASTSDTSAPSPSKGKKRQRKRQSEDAANATTDGKKRGGIRDLARGSGFLGKFKPPGKLASIVNVAKDPQGAVDKAISTATGSVDNALNTATHGIVPSTKAGPGDILGGLGSLGGSLGTGPVSIGADGISIGGTGRNGIGGSVTLGKDGITGEASVETGKGTSIFGGATFGKDGTTVHGGGSIPLLGGDLSLGAEAGKDGVHPTVEWEKDTTLGKVSVGNGGGDGGGGGGVKASIGNTHSSSRTIGALNGWLGGNSAVTVPAPASFVPTSVPKGPISGGAALPDPLRAQFETSLGVDLSKVRIHTGSEAVDAAEAVGARAFAVGQDIMFNAGQFQPGTAKGDALLAHEVAHTVQQGTSTLSSWEQLATTKPGDAVEQQADKAAASMFGGKFGGLTSSPFAFARKGMDEDVVIPEGAGPEGAGGTEGAAGEQYGGELNAGFGGAEEIPGTEPMAPDPETRAELGAMREKGEALRNGQGVDGEGAGGDTGGIDGGPSPQGGDNNGEMIKVSPELQAYVQAAQGDAQAAGDQAKTEGDEFKAELAERRERFESEQEALTIEKLATMSPADKRRTLVEMGFPEKDAKKLKDSELDGIIQGRIATENRKAKILGMDADELKKLSAAQKAQFLVDIGVEKKDVDKIGPAKASQAFDDVLRVAHIPGKHKVKVKIKGGLLGKSWEITLNVDAEGQAEIEAKKKGGFLSKLFGWVKMALPIIAIVLAPLTGGASLIVLAVYQAVTSIATGDWLGAIIGVAGALVGLGAIKGIANSASGIAKGLKKVADVAQKIQKVANAAKAAMMAAKAKSPGGLLAALSSGAAAFATVAGQKATQFSEKMKSWSEKLDKWAKVIQGAEKTLKSIKTGDVTGALEGAFDSATAAFSKKDASGKETNKTAERFARYGRIVDLVSAGKSAIGKNPPDFGAITGAALGMASELGLMNQKSDAARITLAATKLASAVALKDPEKIAEAALGLAETIQLTKVQDDKDGDGKEDADAKKDKEAITERYRRANLVVSAAAKAITAVNQKPRPDYASALEAAGELIAEFTELKRVEAAGKLTKAMDKWTAAIKSGNQQAIFEAGAAFGECIDGFRDAIEKDRDQSEADAKENLGEGEMLPTTNGPTSLPPLLTPVTPNGSVSTSEEFRYDLGPRDDTPGANYTVIGRVQNYPGDTLSTIASRFKTSVDTLRARNPQLVDDKIYGGQRIYVPGAENVSTTSVTTSETMEGLVPGANLDAAQARGKVLEDAQAFYVRSTGDLNWIKAQRNPTLGTAPVVAAANLVQRELDEFRDRLRTPEKYGTNFLQAEMERLRVKVGEVMQTMQNRLDINGRILDFLGATAGWVKSGGDLIIGAVAPPQISGPYFAVTQFIDSYLNQKQGLTESLARAALQGVLEAVSARDPSNRGLDDAKRILETAYKESFKAIAEGTADTLMFANRQPPPTNEEIARFAQSQGLRAMVLSSFTLVKGATNGPGLDEAAQNVVQLGTELLDKVADMVADANNKRKR